MVQLHQCVASKAYSPSNITFHGRDREMYVQIIVHKPWMCTWGGGGGGSGGDSGGGGDNDDVSMMEVCDFTMITSK